MTSRLNGSEPALLERAVKALHRAEKTRVELEALLSRHAPADEARSVVATLTQRGLQSDQRTAEVRARQAQQKGWAAPRALQSLLDAGIAQATAQAAVDEAFANVDARAQLKEEAQRLGSAATPQQRLKAARALVRRGFDQDQVAQALGLDALGLDAQDG